MISKFFIQNPIFASVISIIIVIAGAVAVGVLPIAQYPEITPPTVEVKATYPGASASVVAETVVTATMMTIHFYRVTKNSMKKNLLKKQM